MLRVNLSKLKSVKQEVSKKIHRTFIGGKGFGSKILCDELKPSIEPLGPENKLIIAVGPATGTLIPTASRYGVFFKSPLTNLYGESYSGGTIAPQIKWAGYDVIVIEGSSEKPVYLWIDDAKVEIRDALHLWGRDTYETEDIIREETDKKDSKTLCIGPAGENLVRFACIENDYWRSAGRCGGGAVMGSKKLKAISIRGTHKGEEFDIDRLRECVKESLEKIKNDSVCQNLTNYGTAPMVDNLSAFGIFPHRYWSEYRSKGSDGIDHHALNEKIFVKKKACWGCPIACGRYCEVNDGPYAGTVVEGPELETIYAFGGLCDIDSIEAIAKFNDLCDRYGMDTISTGNVIAFAIEAYARGKIQVKPSLKYGEPDLIIDLIQQIAHKKGIGKVLSEGVKRSSEMLGIENMAIHVKGLEPPAYDPRGLKGMGLSYVISPRGACHLRTNAYTLEVTGKVDRASSDSNKVTLIKDLEDRFAIFDSLIICRFVRNVFEWDLLTKMVNALTGWGLSIKDLKKIAENIVNITHSYNVSLGISRKDDFLPPIFHSLIKEGPSKGMVVTKEELEGMLNTYYNLRKWTF